MSTNPNQAPNQSPITQPGQAGHAVPVLIATTDPCIGRLVDAMLRWEGYEAAIALDEQDALRRLVPKDRATIVIVDHWYATQYGDDLQAFLADPVRRAPHRLIVLTACTNCTAHDMRDHPDEVVKQPFALEGLLATVERMEHLILAELDATRGFTIDM